ncbi:hypothetical protein JCM6882_004470 [Rhodosporidiobolus microsporus]
MSSQNLSSSLREEALAIERSYARALEFGGLEDLEAPCAQLFRRATLALDAEVLHPSTLTALRRVASFISVVSAGLRDLDRGHRRIKEGLVDKLRSTLKESSPSSSTTVSSAPSTPDPSNPDDPQHYAPYRLWFLSNFSSPYPSPTDKDALLALVPLHNKQQLDTWFTNNRRRSGWQALKREHTNGSAEDLERLLKSVDRGERGVGEETAEKVRKVRAFFEDGGAKDRVSEQIQAIVAGSAPGVTTGATATRGVPRRVEKRAQRGVSSSSSSSAAFPPPPATPYARQSTPPRRQQHHQPTFAYGGDLVVSPSSSDLPPLPRYPSTFASPSASSSRTVSSSSSSSLDSLVSYASAQSTFPTAAAASDIPAVPSSPPASSSLLSFAGPSTSSSSHHHRGGFAPYPPTAQRRPTRAHPPPAAPQHLGPSNPYFCTLADLPSSSSILGGAVGGSTLASALGAAGMTRR